MLERDDLKKYGEMVHDVVQLLMKILIKFPCLNYLLERGRRFVQAKLTQTFEMMLWKRNFSLKVEDETISSVPARLLGLTE